MIALFFGLFAALTVFPALALAFQRNIVYSAFMLLMVLVGMAGLYILLSADFIAVTQILIYVGGILTLFLFGVLLTKRKDTRYLVSAVQYPKRSAFIAISLVLFLLILVHKESYLFKSGKQAASVELIGKGLISQYLLPFELAGVLLLVILVGVLVLASIVKLK